MKTYIIILSNEVSNIDFNQVLETSASTLRYNLDKSKTFVKFEGDTPSFLNGKTEYTEEQILTILDTNEWSEEDE